MISIILASLKPPLSYLPQDNRDDSDQSTGDGKNHQIGTDLLLGTVLDSGWLNWQSAKHLDCSCRKTFSWYFT